MAAKVIFNVQNQDLFSRHIFFLQFADIITLRATSDYLKSGTNMQRRESDESFEIAFVIRCNSS